MIITLNGSVAELPEGSTITAVLEQKGVDGAIVVVVVNRDVIHRDRFDQTLLNNGDTVEVLRFVGGG